MQLAVAELASRLVSQVVRGAGSNLEVAGEDSYGRASGDPSGFIVCPLAVACNRFGEPCSMYAFCPVHFHIFELLCFVAK